MVTKEERMKVLLMIQEGKISVDDGAKLLSTLEEQDRAASRGKSFRFRTDPRSLRVRVTDQVSGKTKVSVVLPMGLVDAGLNIASNFVTISDEEAMEQLREAIDAGMVGQVLDFYDASDGEHVQIFIE